MQSAGGHIPYFQIPPSLSQRIQRPRHCYFFFLPPPKKKQMMQSAGGQTLSANPPESRTEPAGPSHDEMIGFSVSPANEQ